MLHYPADSRVEPFPGFKNIFILVRADLPWSDTDTSCCQAEQIPCPAKFQNPRVLPSPDPLHTISPTTVVRLCPVSVPALDYRETVSIRDLV